MPFFEDGNPLGQLECDACEGWGTKGGRVCEDCSGSGYDRENDERIVRTSRKEMDDDI